MLSVTPTKSISKDRVNSLERSLWKTLDICRSFGHQYINGTITAIIIGGLVLLSLSNIISVIEICTTLNTVL